MPEINKYITNLKTSKKFKKNSHRPWDYLCIDQKNNITDVTQEHSIVQKEVLYEDLSIIWNKLYGARKEVLIFVIKAPHEILEDYVITSNISTNEIYDNTEIPKNTIKTVVQQLKTSKILSSIENKPGRGGFARYKFSRVLHNFLSKKISDME